MLQKLRRRNYAESTIDAYIHTVEHFSRQPIPVAYEVNSYLPVPSLVKIRTSSGVIKPTAMSSSPSPLKSATAAELQVCFSGVFQGVPNRRKAAR